MNGLEIWLFGNIIAGVALAIWIPRLGLRPDGTICDCRECMDIVTPARRYIWLAEFVIIGSIAANLAALLRIAGGGA